MLKETRVALSQDHSISEYNHDLSNDSQVLSCVYPNTIRKISSNIPENRHHLTFSLQLPTVDP